MNGRKLYPFVVIAAGPLACHNSLTGAFVFEDFGSSPENPTVRRR